MKDVVSKNVINKIYKNHHVYIEPKIFTTLKDGIEYVARYCGRPCISENRIIKYDGKNVRFDIMLTKINLIMKLLLLLFNSLP